MQPAPQKPEVVYRRMPEGGPAAVRPSPFESWRRGLAPAVTPLIIGFLLLLGLIFAVGLWSVRLTAAVSNEAFDVGRQRSGRLSLLWDLHAGVTRLDNEARARARFETARGGFAPPFDLQLNTARGEVVESLKRLDSPPLSDNPAWIQLREDLKKYIDVTQDSKRYSLDGFTQFHSVDKELNDLFLAVHNEKDGILDRVLQNQAASRKSIITWTVIALLVGALVAAGTVWQVQRHFSGMRRSMLEARRERTFTTQM